MKLELNKKYIDKLGNISVSSKGLDFFDKPMDNRTTITHIDNIRYPSVKTVGETKFLFNTDSGTYNLNEKAVINIVKEFTLINEIQLRLERFLFSIIPTRLQYGFDEFDSVDYKRVRVKSYLKAS